VRSATGASIWPILAALAAATLLTRLPFLTPRLAHWDAVNYALGLHDFDVGAHQPHPPGSPYFIALGRLALAVVGDDNAALIGVSLVASVAAVMLEFLLARACFGTRAGVLAAVLLLTQPVFWGYGAMAMPWTLLATLALAIGLVCMKLAYGHRAWLVPSAALVGLASGFRLDATVFLTPLWLWAVGRTTSQPKRKLLAALIALALVLAWMVPVAAATGGIRVWSERLLALFVRADAPLEAWLRQLVANTASTLGIVGLAISPALVFSPLSNRQAALGWLDTQPKAVWALWVAPPLVFLWLVDSTEPGHNLVYLVALCALAAGLMTVSARSTRQLLAAGALVAAMQTGIFLFAAPRTDKPPPWVANSMLLNVTVSGLQQYQVSLDETIGAVRAQFDPADTALITIAGQDAYRPVMYYLPEYRVVHLDPAHGTFLTARHREQGSWREITECPFADAPPRRTAWIVWTHSEPGLVPSNAAPVAGGKASRLQVWDVTLEGATADYLGLDVGAGCALSR
jgi:4-amino-4-deoxy-L-arabinose transferase-like glycosyltransferase